MTAAQWPSSWQPASHPLYLPEVKKSPCLCLVAGNWGSARVTVPTTGRVCPAQSGHFGLGKHHSHNHWKRGCRTAPGHRFRKPPSVFPGFDKVFNEGIIWNTWVIIMGQLLHMQVPELALKWYVFEKKILVEIPNSFLWENRSSFHGFT